MLKLYGFAVSNYYNMVKHALQAKGVAFEDVVAFPGADPGYLAKSPLGKIPCIETEHGFLSETSIILDYLEARYPEQRLSPTDAWGQAKMKELMKISELYLELQGRRLMPAVMRGVQLDQATLDDVGSIMRKGFAAIAKLGQFKPYLMGDQMTLADIFLRYSLSLAKGGAGLVKLDVNQAVPALAAWEKLMGESPISQTIDAKMMEELPKFMEMMKKQQG